MELKEFLKKWLDILDYPQKIISEKEQKIYQSIVIFEQFKEYVVRIIVNSVKNPMVIITLYKTSKIKKYNEG